MKKLLLCFILSFLLISCIGEVKSLNSFKIIDKYPLYSMKYYGDYGFDDFLKVGAKNDTEVEEFVRARLLGQSKGSYEPVAGGCTVFSVKNTENQVLFGRNFDFDFSPCMVLQTAPDNGYKSISLVNLGFLGYNKDKLPKKMSKDILMTLAGPYLPFEGMNEKGVAIALLAVPYAEPPKKDGQTTLNTTTAIRLVLDKAASVNEAIDLLKKYNYYFSGDVACHYLIADAQGDSALVEFMDNEVQVIRTKESYQVASNFIAYKDIRAGEGFDEFDRYNKVEEKLKKLKGNINENDTMKILESVSIKRTQWSAVYNLSKKTVSVSMGKNYDKQYSFDIKE